MFVSYSNLIMNQYVNFILIIYIIRKQWLGMVHDQEPRKQKIHFYYKSLYRVNR